MGGENPQKLGGENNLRHQHQRRLSPGEDRLNKANIYLCLAAACHAVKKGGGGTIPPGQGVQAIKGRLLRLVERRGRRRVHVLQGRAPQHLLLFQS